MSVTPVPVEDLQLGDVIAQLPSSWHWQVVGIKKTVTRKGDQVLFTRYRLSTEGLGVKSGLTRNLTYYEGEKVPFVRQATIAETATKRFR